MPDKPIKKKKKLSDLTMEDVRDCQTCKDKPTHVKHICFLARQREINAITKLANKPKHICLICGRVANNEENLCTPFEM
ncbi:hypothetical protein KKB99_02425 [bacterium]|nr:hypothetical protein [bacterium]MBU1024843.1 hypothetical protein [bacterium]